MFLLTLETAYYHDSLLLFERAGKSYTTGLQCISVKRLHAEILKAMPGCAPTARAWGKYKSGHQNKTCFLLTDFLDMRLHNKVLLNAGYFCSKIAELHVKGQFPNGKLGFQ
jgi:hypothetical protein